MDLLQPGQKLSLNFQKNKKLVEIFCTIHDILDDRLVIDLPPYFMRYIEFLEVGCELTVKVFSKLGTIDFNTIVISSPLEDDFAVELDVDAMKLKTGDEIPVVNAIETLKITKNDTTYIVKTFELSTEYFKFYSDTDFEVNESFDCELILPKDYGTISFRATITEVDDIYDNEYKATYYYMSEYDRQALLYYMYVYTSETNELTEKNEEND